MFDGITNIINNFTVNICQMLAMIVIFIGIIKALYVYIRDQ
jgi:hypothetical protein